MSDAIPQFGKAKGEGGDVSLGKGNHPAGLNFGDCAAYALSRVSGEPLLFKGNDFARTDVAGVP